ncbi:hypothetical protein HDU67_008887, partial [Dinochytrium kinnereticum]
VSKAILDKKDESVSDFTFLDSADKAIKDFNIHRLLGGGISGQEKASKVFVAVKLIRKDGKRGDETSQTLKYESSLIAYTLEKAPKKFVALKLVRKDGKRRDETSQAVKYER